MSIGNPCTRARAAGTFLLGVVCAAILAGAPKLSKRHQEWLTQETSLLITKVEREAFLNLKTDQERDTFIERFWEIRNPDPGSGTNEFKEEFYRRVAYANAFYGREAGTDGWRTDRGRTYILFGRPQTSMNYHGNQELYPIELWFYSNPGLSELPAFFYVLFYEKDGIGGYRLYHPYVDGPDKLMRARPEKAQAYRYLKSISPELARASLTLIPGEPADTDTFSGSMSSAAVLNGINGYRDMPSYVALIQERARRLERVTTRIDYDIARSDLLAFVFYTQGEPWLDWRIEVRDPAQPKVKAGKLQYEITARLFSGGGLVYERTDAPSAEVPERAAPGMDRRPFVYEDRMPVVEGKYRLSVGVRNRAAGRSYEATKEFSVERKPDRTTLSDILVLERHEADARERPFCFGGVKFFPTALGHTTAAGGLKVLYEVAIPEPRPAELEVEYVIGSVAGKFRKTVSDKLDTRLADARGSLVTARTLPITELSPGVYQLAVQVKDPRDGKITARSASFRVVEGAPEAPPIVIAAARAPSPERLAANHYERALCWLAQQRPQEALASLDVSRNFTSNPAVEGLRQLLSENLGRLAKARGDR